MMGATFPAEPIKPYSYRHAIGLERYVRQEYGGDDPTWLVRELEGTLRDKPALKRQPARRHGFSLRALAAKVASLLF